MTLPEATLRTTHAYVQRILDDPGLAREVGDALIIAARNRERFPERHGQYLPSRVALNVIKARFPLDVDGPVPSAGTSVGTGHVLMRKGAQWECSGCDWEPLLGESGYAAFDQHLLEVRSG